MKRAITTIACAGLLASGCVSATVVDARLTALGRTAVPLAAQSQIQQVDDAATCRENIMDSLVYVGAYTLYNPFRFPRQDEMLYVRQQQLAQCLRDRKYGVLEPLPPPVRN
jgi:hypothetical protein